ncbi:MAG: alpha/beta hydrolase [Sulfuricellaceae bacterium]|nr:alpha/beta hydrolase [Sulfuricellaceae bacterium]
MAILTPDVEGYLNLPQQIVHYRIYRKTASRERRLLLLHGGGVDGAITWEAIIPHLQNWSEILVPDLRGVGKTHFPDRIEHPFSTLDVVSDLQLLLKAQAWDQYDLAGYSYGGLVAMQLKAECPDKIAKTYLLEPGLLSGADEKLLLDHREALLQATQKLRIDEELEHGLRIFLDIVSPKRNQNSRNEEIVRARLSHRPKGLACVLEAVTQAARSVDRSKLIAAQSHVSSFVGARSNGEIHDFCQELANQRQDWDCHLIEGADHALPFQKPERIAQLMDKDMGRYLTR